MSFQPPPPGDQPPPPPGGWQPPPPPPGAFGGPPPPPPAGGFGGQPGFGAPPPAAGGSPWSQPAPPPAPNKSRKGLFLGLGLGAAVVLLLLVVGLASLASKVSGGTALADLHRGECFNTSKALVSDKATRVDCAKPHTDEVAGILKIPGADGSPYPGQNGILAFGKSDCVEPVTSFYGDKTPTATTQVFVFGPNEAAWKNGDRTVVCSLREESAVKRTGSYLDA